MILWEGSNIMLSTISLLHKYKNTLIIASFIGLAVFSFTVFFLSYKTLHLMLLWNVFLSFIPIFISKRITNKKTFMAVLYWILWLIFIPNAFYMLTDYMHVQQIVFSKTISPYEVQLSRDIVIWLELCNIIICIQTGVMMGCISMHHIHKVIGTKLYFVMLPFLSTVIGIAIYIGRYLRFNSWDILRPHELLEKLIFNIDVFSIQFIVLFAIITFLINVVFYVFVKFIMLMIMLHERNKERLVSYEGCDWR